MQHWKLRIKTVVIGISSPLRPSARDLFRYDRRNHVHHAHDSLQASSNVQQNLGIRDDDCKAFAKSNEFSPE
jgi:hypothetical protein